MFLPSGIGPMSPLKIGIPRRSRSVLLSSTPAWECVRKIISAEWKSRILSEPSAARVTTRKISFLAIDASTIFCRGETGRRGKCLVEGIGWIGQSLAFSALGPTVRIDRINPYRETPPSTAWQRMATGEGWLRCVYTSHEFTYHEFGGLGIC